MKKPEEIVLMKNKSCQFASPYLVNVMINIRMKSITVKQIVTSNVVLTKLIASINMPPPKAPRIFPEENTISHTPLPAIDPSISSLKDIIDIIITPAEPNPNTPKPIQIVRRVFFTGRKGRGPIRLCPRAANVVVTKRQRT